MLRGSQAHFSNHVLTLRDENIVCSQYEQRDVLAAEENEGKRMSDREPSLRQDYVHANL